jgi:hypothetical protein
VHDFILNPGWDTFLVAGAFVLATAVGVFRLDAIVAKPKSGARRAERTCGTTHRGEPMLCDPDGRPWADPAEQK